MKKLMKLKFFLNKNHNKKKINELYKLYNETQFWPIEDLRSYQLESFKKLFRFCEVNVPYYRNLFKNLKITSSDIHSLDDLHKIPILTKDIIRQNREQLKATNLPPNRFILNSTSGYSGSNLEFFSDSETIHSRNALTFRRYDWMNVSYFEKEFVIWGAPWDIEQNKYYAHLKKLLNIENTVNYSGYNLSDDNLSEIGDYFLKANPQIIHIPSLFAPGTYAVRIKLNNNNHSNQVDLTSNSLTFRSARSVNIILLLISLVYRVD